MRPAPHFDPVVEAERHLAAYSRTAVGQPGRIVRPGVTVALRAALSVDAGTDDPGGRP